MPFPGVQKRDGGLRFLDELGCDPSFGGAPIRTGEGHTTTTEIRSWRMPRGRGTIPLPPFIRAGALFLERDLQVSSTDHDCRRIIELGYHMHPQDGWRPAASAENVMYFTQRRCTSLGQIHVRNRRSLCTGATTGR